MRALGLLEKYQVSKLLTRCYGSITLTAVLEHDAPSGDIRQFYLSWLYPALLRLVAKHPLLTAVVQDADKETAHFITVSDFSLESIVTFDELEYWKPNEQAKRLAEQCDKTFDYDNHSVPLWRLHIDTHSDRPKECSITFAVQHVIADGKSLTIFWQDLLEYLYDGNNETSVSPPFLFQANKEKAIQPAYEDRGAPRLSIMDKLHLLAGHMLPSLFGDTRDVWRGDRPLVKDRAKARHDTVVQVVRIDPAIWNKICATAKRHGITPHAAIMTSIMLTFAKLYPEEPAVKSSTPVNCRGLINPCIPHDEIGNFVGSYSRHWTSSEMKDITSFWNVAKTYHQGLQANKLEAAKQVFQLEFLSSFPKDYCETLCYEKWEKYAPMGREGGIELSDLGRCSAKARELYFCQTVNIFTLAINVNTVSTLDAMHATIAYQKDTLDESKMDQFGATLMNTLELSLQQ
ncbi:hypothetical protein K492DRAFT_174130 [Lichtheimia hyalospora FSU 10163]|nr:hypothetical protein K492DRAFT_174130 [Lichtheimia hyalospora FSU 10163]